MLPEIIKKNIDSILKEIHSKSPFYTPEWNFDENDKFGEALSNIFASMYEMTIKRLNYAPMKHLLSFLETINTSLIPSHPSRTALTFVTSKGATGNILIKALTQAAGKDSEGKSVVFETEKNIIATPRKLQSIYSVTREKVKENANDTAELVDKIFDLKDTIDGKEPLVMFGDVDIQKHILYDIQKHILYIGDSDLLNIKKGKITIQLEGELLSELKKEYVDWEYSMLVKKKVAGKDEEIVDWGDLKSENIENNGLLIIKSTEEQIAEIELNGIKSRWIRCIVKKSQIKNVKDIKIKSIRILTSPNGAEGTQGIEPDMLYYNDVPIDKFQTFYPFGTKPKLYDTFYIASDEAFSKKGYNVDLKIVGLEKGLPSCPENENTPIISWEYWDGEGWSSFGNVTDIFTGTGCCTSTDPAEAKPKFIAIPNDSGNPTPKPISNPPSTTEPPFTLSSSIPEMKPTTINGKDGYWIRARLVGGDFGKEYKIEDNKVYPGRYCPPSITGLKIHYSKSGVDTPAYILKENNLLIEEVEIEKETFSFKPFDPLPDTDQSIYYGFDGALEGGPISIFVSIDESIDESLEYPEDFRPRIKWECYSESDSEVDGEKWIEINTLDGTEGFTKSGTIEFIITDKMKGKKIFGSESELYWIRAVITKDTFEFLTEDKVSSAFRIHLIKRGFPKPPLIYTPPNPSQEGSIEPVIAPRVAEASLKLSDAKESAECACSYKMEECKPLIDVFNISLINEKIRKLPPKILGFYLNSAWAKQSRTISDEILGSSNGERSQVFKLQNTPVIESNVWVDEINSLSEGERIALSKSNIETDERKDADGNISEFWIKWDTVGDFANSDHKSRHYLIGNTIGEISFGDGKNGMIPPLGINNVMATYKVGGGKSGNQAPLSISKLQTAITYVDSVYNPIASSGGDDVETVDDLIKRAPTTIKHRHKAVALEDYEWIAKEASEEVAKVKVIPNMNDGGNFETGYVKVAIIPNSTDARPSLSPELKKRIESYLRERCPNLATVKVIQPSYARIDVTSELITKSIDAVPLIENEARKKIRGFLHPLTGGKDGKGWDFGAVPCISDIYLLFEQVKDVDYVNSLKIRLEAENLNPIEISDNSSLIVLPDYAILYSGEHNIRATWDFEKEE
jgi:hypothetical protein